MIDSHAPAAHPPAAHSPPTATRQAAWFVALGLLLALGLGLPAAAASHGLAAGPLEALAAFVVLTPATAALLLAWRHGGLRRLVAPLAAWRVPLRWYAVALLLPVAINATALAVVAALGAAVPSVPGTVPGELRAVAGHGAPSLLVLTAVFLLGSLGEELGWRGYLLPRLQLRFSALGASLLLAVPWAIFHLPHMLTADAAQAQLPLGWYLSALAATTVLFTWLYNSTGASLLPVTLLHASTQAANIAIPVLPSETGDARLYAAQAAVTIVVAVLVLAACGPARLCGVRRLRRHRVEAGR